MGFDLSDKAIGSLLVGAEQAIALQGSACPYSHVLDAAYRPYITRVLIFVAAVAQLVEHSVVIRAVAGSSPVSRPTLF